MFLQQLRLRHDVVIDEDNELPDRFLDPRIAGSSGTPIGLRKPPQPHRGAERFQVGVRTVGRAIGDYDDFISVRRVRLLLEGRDHMSQSSKTIVRRYDNTEVGAGCLHCLGPEFAGTGSIGLSIGPEPNSVFRFLQSFCYHNASLSIQQTDLTPLHPAASSLMLYACIVGTPATALGNWPKAEAALAASVLLSLLSLDRFV